MTEELLEENPVEELYIPSGTEKKQAFLMYMLIGLILAMGKDEVSPYTYHHLKQSMWWLVLFLLTVFLTVILLIFWAVLGTFFSFIGLFIFVPVVVIGIVCMKQALDGEYQRNSEGALKFFGVFSWLWIWILNLFDANHYHVFDEKSVDQNEIQTPNIQQTIQQEMQNQQGITQYVPLNIPQVNPQMNPQVPQNVQQTVQQNVQPQSIDPLSQMGISETIGTPMPQ